jgi:MoxR-like ATPase
MKDLDREYHGDGKPHYGEPDNPKHKTPREPYIASPELVEAVNLAMYLRRPLLLEGDPGCGKTRLAYALAHELGRPLKTCYIRSTTRARDLLYDYDQLRRLYDIQETKTCGPRSAYLTLGELGEAIRLSAKEGIPAVTLIDEIDKADIDFPNDLLLTLDEWKFKAEEIRDEKTEGVYDALKGRSVEDFRDRLPIVVVTSNQEKELPAPFLRRCVYFYIEFPDETTLRRILKEHLGEAAYKQKKSLLETAAARFMDLREKTEFRWRKKPSTSEFLDWVRALLRDEREDKRSVENLGDLPLVGLPHLSVLVKTQSDRQALGHV